MAFTPNNFPAAMREIKRISANNKKIHEENNHLRAELKKAKSKLDRLVKQQKTSNKEQ